MGLRTPLYDSHVAAGAKIVDFGGWDMPLHYGSQIDEHHAVRQDAGVFDVSHMTVVDVRGEQAVAYLRYLLANDVAKLKTPGKGLYSCMLNEAGGVVDDLIVYRHDEQNFRVIVNAATRDKDIAWMRKHAAGFAVDVVPAQDYAMLAVQGPQAVGIVCSLLPKPLGEQAGNLAPFESLQDESLFVARTGYTGEDGYELVVPAAQAAAWWDRLVSAGVKPAGLGARDTLRMEAGMSLYGQDIDVTVSPLESGLSWTVAMDPAERSFLGREALERQQADGVGRQLVGLLLQGRGIMRHGQRVVTSTGDGEITSGGFSPTMQESIALARIPVGAIDACEVEIRNKRVAAKVVKPRFVRHGKVCVGS